MIDDDIVDYRIETQHIPELIHRLSQAMFMRGSKENVQIALHTLPRGDVNVIVEDKIVATLRKI